jgi:hypothetical protein
LKESATKEQYEKWEHFLLTAKPNELELLLGKRFAQKILEERNLAKCHSNLNEQEIIR